MAEISLCFHCKVKLRVLLYQFDPRTSIAKLIKVGNSTRLEKRSIIYFAVHQFSSQISGPV